MAENAPVYKRILLKLSGEALAGQQGYGIDPDVITPSPPRFVKSSVSGCRSHW